MDKATIYINYSDTINKADSMIELADQLSRLNQEKLKEIGVNLNSIWTGDAAEMFKKSMFSMNDRLDKRVNQITSAADGLKKSAERLRMVEEAMVALINATKN